ncbi:MAG: hypothetical protein ChlgKO_09640 [Chlamydiales bacterium]
MVRDLTTVYIFGANASVAAFLAAFRFANVVRRLLGEGPFQSAFIPHFEQLRVQGGEKEFFKQLMSLVAFVLFFLVIGGEIAVRYAATIPGMSSVTIEMLHLMRYLLPGTLFICLYGLNISFYHCHHSFFTPSFTPAICNVFWIGAIWIMRDRPVGEAMVFLAKAVFLGYLFQWLLTLPLVIKEKAFGFVLKIPQEIRTFLRFVTLTMIGVGAVQINTLFDTMFAIKADPRAVTYLWNSLRLQQFVLALFGMAAVSTLIPKLTRAVKEGKESEAKEIFVFCIKRLLLILIPCTFATICLGQSAVTLLYYHGKFTTFDVMQTSRCLFAYGLGIIPTALIMLYSAIFYAKHRALYPSFVAIGMVVLNISLNAFFVMGLQLGSVSVAIATTICAWLHVGILSYKLWHEGWQVEKTQWLRLSIVGLISAALVPSGSFLVQAAVFSTTTLLFVFLFGPRELLSFLIQLVDKNPSKSR